MPKVSKIQPGFSTGEISKQVYGRVDNPRYELALQYCQNYLPLIQGPLVRRPGTKFVANVKDASRPPVLIPFQFSATQNYMLEVGDKYIRFYQNEGQTVTSSNSFLVSGLYGQADPLVNTNTQHTLGFTFTGIRPVYEPNVGEQITASSLFAAGNILELQTPYAWADIKSIKWAQKQDNIYLTHPSYQPMTLQRTGLNTWDLKTVIFQDGPYLPLNSYKTIADSARVVLTPVPYIPGVSGSSQVTVSTGPILAMSSVISSGSSTLRVFLNNTVPYNLGDKLFVSGVVYTGSAYINNVSGTTGSDWLLTNSSPLQAFWTLHTVQGSSIILTNPAMQSPPGTTFTYTGSGTIQPALLQLVTGSSGTSWADITISSNTLGVAVAGFQSLRNIAFVNNGTRYWGHIFQVINTANFNVNMGLGQSIPTGSSPFWSLGTYNLINGFPSACTFHQDRLVFNGPPSAPQEIDASMTSQYEVFSTSGSNFQVANNNALQFNLASQDLNAIRWMKSNSQGLLCGTHGGEWAVTPSSQGAALTPTNISANQVTAFGCADTDALLVGNAALYVQRAQRKVRELLYFWQVGNFRSTNVSELAQHITVPQITKIVNQKEPHAFIWGLRSDGNLLSLTYNRDDVTLQANAGWARHVLGGRSDTSGSPPYINSIGVIPSGDTTFDELWLVTQRYLNGSNAACIEYMTKLFDDYQAQETAYHLDCGATYNSSIVVTGISIGSSAVITAPNHGLANSSSVRFYNTVGLNVQTVDVNGVVGSSNLFNEKSFLVTSVATNTFYVKDFLGNYINTNSASVYVGSAVINQLVSSVSGLTWLAGEQVAVVADGGIHVNTSVTQAGVLTLAYPAAIVSVGYPYNSDGQMLRTHEGSAQGTSIGSTRRVNRVAFMLHNVGDLSFGPSFDKLIPAEFYPADVATADTASPLFDGIHRDGIESSYGFTDDICFRQSSGLPGMIQSIVRFLEENDV